MSICSPHRGTKTTGSPLCPSDGGWVLNNKFGACYKFFSEKKTAREASELCSSYEGGVGLLAELVSEEEVLFIQKQLLPVELLGKVQKHLELNNEKCFQYFNDPTKV